MKVIKAGGWVSILALGLFLVPEARAATAETVSTNGEFVALGELTLQLLQTGDARAFAKAIVASAEDWQELQHTNKTEANSGPSPQDLKDSAVYTQQKVAKTAQNIVDTARRLGLDPSQVTFRFKEAKTPPHHQTWSSAQSRGQALPWYENIKIVLSGTPVQATNQSRAGDYELTIANLVKLPSGWRSFQGLRWTGFPARVVDQGMQREMKIAEAVAARKPIRSTDDPALAELGKKILRFLRTRDEKVFTTEAMLNIDDIWKKMEKETARPHPSRKELEEEWPKFTERIVASAREALAQAERWGLDFSSAEINEVTAADLRHRGAEGSLENLEANSITFAFTVTSPKKSTSGVSLSGEYLFVTGEALRLGDQWKIQHPVRWGELPPGVVPKGDLEQLQFENYVAEKNTLPPGTVAPDVEFVRLDNQKKEKLSSCGKVLVVDFWATWCGPCQQPMAELQKIRQEHPDWKDRVEIISLSIDDTADPVRKHLAKNGWTNTFNVWAGPGGWASKPAKQFRVTGVPTTYVIGKDGKILQAGHPAGLQIPELVSSALK